MGALDDLDSIPLEEMPDPALNQIPKRVHDPNDDIPVPENKSPVVDEDSWNVPDLPGAATSTTATVDVIKEDTTFKNAPKEEVNKDGVIQASLEDVAE